MIIVVSPSLSEASQIEASLRHDKSLALFEDLKNMPIRLFPFVHGCFVSHTVVYER